MGDMEAGMRGSRIHILVGKRPSLRTAMEGFHQTTRRSLTQSRLRAKKGRDSAQ